jgi:hypothetical protein
VKATNLHGTIILFFKSSEVENCEDYGSVKIYRGGRAGRKSEGKSLLWRK